MDKESREAWNSMYCEEERTLYLIWTCEKPAFRRIAMIHHILNKELSKYKASMDEEVNRVKVQLNQKEVVRNFTSLDNTVDFEMSRHIQCNSNDNNKENLPQKPPVTIEDDSSTTDISRANTPEITKPIEPTEITQKSPIISVENRSRLKSRQKTAPTTLNDSNILDSSVIDSTPDVAAKRQRTNRSTARKTSNIRTKSKMKKSIDQNNTLTQMFPDTVTTKDQSSKVVDPNQASLDLDEMMALINHEENDKTVDFIKNYDRIPANKQQQPKFAYREVVRGKEARKQLKGWSCKECENYYKLLDLPEEELQKKKDECSKHRAKFKMQETYEGFWDLSFGPTPKTPTK